MTLSKIHEQVVKSKKIMKKYESAMKQLVDEPMYGLICSTFYSSRLGVYVDTIETCDVIL